MGNQTATARDAGSRKRPRDGDVNEGGTYHPRATEDGEEDEPPGPESKTLKRRTARSRPNRDTEPTRAGERQHTDDPPPRGSRASAERASPPVPPETSPSEARRIQKRVYWTGNDERVLKMLVSKHGCFWGHMEKRAMEEGLFSAERSQQQIRDKARNMKVRMLRYTPPQSDTPFPRASPAGEAILLTRGTQG